MWTGRQYVYALVVRVDEVYNKEVRPHNLIRFYYLKIEVVYLLYTQDKHG